MYTMTTSARLELSQTHSRAFEMYFAQFGFFEASSFVYFSDIYSQQIFIVLDTYNFANECGCNVYARIQNSKFEDSGGITDCCIIICITEYLKSPAKLRLVKCMTNKQLDDTLGPKCTTER